MSEPLSVAVQLQMIKEQEEELAKAVTDLLAWVYPIAGDNIDEEAADNETRTVERVKKLIELRKARIEFDIKRANNEE